ncbi:MAG: hypothetical protein GQ476_02830, partial [Candidatus Aminicenantes bacterium]|nr:hypothetical protein [Candidatus Aminicenantes bacterium]
MILPAGNLYLLSRSQMRAFDVTAQMIKIKEKKEFTCEEQNWGDLTIGTAVYPEDGKTS